MIELVGGFNPGTRKRRYPLRFPPLWAYYAAEIKPGVLQ